MSNVVTSIARKFKPTRNETVAPPRHRRDGFFDDSGTWHDAESGSAVLASGSVAS